MLVVFRSGKGMDMENRGRVLIEKSLLLFLFHTFNPRIITLAGHRFGVTLSGEL